MREVEEGSLEDLQDPQSTVVKLMVEEPHSNEENDVFFPLDGKLYAWQKFLRIGECLITTSYSCLFRDLLTHYCIHILQEMRLTVFLRAESGMMPSLLSRPSPLPPKILPLRHWIW